MQPGDGTEVVSIVLAAALSIVIGWAIYSLFYSGQGTCITSSAGNKAAPKREDKDPKNIFPFFKLPAELRDEIYTLSTVKRHAKPSIIPNEEEPTTSDFL